MTYIVHGEPPAHARAAGGHRASWTRWTMHAPEHRRQSRSDKGVTVRAADALTSQGASRDGDRDRARSGRARRPMHPYLLERVGEAAVVQLYADGFAALPLREKILVWHLAQAAIAGPRHLLRPAIRATTSRCATCSRRSLPHGAADADEAREAIVRYTKLFWINTGPYNNLTAQKFVLECSPEAFAQRRARSRRARRAAARCAPVSRSTRCSRGCGRCSSTGGRSDGHEQDARRGPRHPRREREQPVRRRHAWPISTASRRRIR